MKPWIVVVVATCPDHGIAVHGSMQVCESRGDAISKSVGEVLAAGCPKTSISATNASEVEAAVIQAAAAALAPLPMPPAAGSA